MTRRLFAPVAMLLLLYLPHDATAGPVYVGSVIDALGDTLSGTDPDIVAAEIVIDDSWFTFSMTFAPGTLNPATTRSGFTIDIDQNTATGTSWNGLGVDFVVSQGYLGSTDTAFMTVGGGATVPVSFYTDRVEYSFARSLFGAEDGVLDFIAHVQIALAAGVSTPIVDFAPHPSRGPTSTRLAAVPEPATLTMLAGGLSLLCAYRQRRRRPNQRG